MSENSKTMNEFAEMSLETYKTQACFFLDRFYDELKDKSEELWNETNWFIKLDDDGENGHGLDELEAHKFLERNGMTMTVIDLRAHLRRVDLNKDGHMSLLEFCADHFGKTVDEIMKFGKYLPNDTLVEVQDLLQAIIDEIARIEAKKADLRARAEGDGVKARLAFASLFEMEHAENDALNEKLIHAEAAVRYARKHSGASHNGTLWWVERDLEELKKYKPKGNLRQMSAFKGL